MKCRGFVRNDRSCLRKGKGKQPKDKFPFRFFFFFFEIWLLVFFLLLFVVAKLVRRERAACPPQPVTHVNNVIWSTDARIPYPWRFLQ